MDRTFNRRRNYAYGGIGYTLGWRVAQQVERVVTTRSHALGSVGFENPVNENGERLIWLERTAVDRLRSLRGPGESYSDVILRLVVEVG
jgi:hypothetical protein